MNSCYIPTSPSCLPQMETVVKNPLTSPVKCFQLRHKSGLYHFHLVAVNVIFLWGTFCKLWPWLFCSYCFQTCHVLHLSKPGNMSQPNYGVCEEQTNQRSSSLLFPKIDSNRCMYMMWWLFVWSGELTVKLGREEVACGCYSSCCWFVSGTDQKKWVKDIWCFAPLYLTRRVLSCVFFEMVKLQHLYISSLHRHSSYSWCSIDTNTNQGLFLTIKTGCLLEVDFPASL